MSRILIGFFIIIMTSPAAAHEVQMTTRTNSPSLVIQAVYANGEPLSYAAFTVYSPDPTSPEYQSGRTDANGNLAIAPDQTGSWKVAIDDEMGHRGEIRIDLEDAFFEESSTREAVVKGEAILGQLPLFAKFLVGICLIFGMTGVFYWLKARRLMKRPEDE